MNSTLQLDTLPLSAIQPSPTNPRKHFDEQKIAQLADTIKSQGFLQRLLVRPCPGKPEVFELVDGERRWRAAKLLGIEMLPVDVRNLTDAEVIEIQLVAGETGEPLTPIEEGHGFKRALELKDAASGLAVYTLRSLAEKLGCSKTHIEQRIALVRLPANVQEWVASGSLPPRTANLLARIADPVAMGQAIEDVVFPKHREDPLPYKEAEAVIHERYMVSLRNAPFDVNDATFDGPVLDEETKKWLPQACATCLLKTGNDPERFGDVKDKNVCTKPGCYRARCNVAWERAAAKAKAAGQRVLTDEEAAEVFEKNSPVVQIAFSSPYVDVDSKPSYRHVPNEVEDKNLPTWRELINTAEEKKGLKVPIVLARDRTGKQWQLVQLTLCIEAARAIGEDMFRKTPVNESISSKDRFDRDTVRTAVRQTDDFAAKKKAEADAAKLRMAECMVGLGALYARLSSQEVFNNGTWGLLLHTALHHAGNDGQALIVKWLNLKTGGGEFEYSDAIESWFKKSLPPPESAYRNDRSGAHALIPLLLIAPSMRWNGLKCEGFLALAKGHGVDLKEIHDKAEAVLRNKSKEPRAKGKEQATKDPETEPKTGRPKGRELEPEELKEMAERYARRPATEIAFRFGISVPLAKWYAEQSAKPKSDFAATDKPAEIRALLLKGKEPTEIAKTLGISLPAVHFAKKMLAREGPVKKRRVAVQALVDKGKTAIQIAMELGLSMPEADRTLSALGFTGAGPWGATDQPKTEEKKPASKKSSTRPEKTGAVDDERKVRELRANGRNFTEIYIATQYPRGKLKKLIAKIDAEFKAELAARKGSGK